MDSISPCKPLGPGECKHIHCLWIGEQKSDEGRALGETSGIEHFSVGIDLGLPFQIRELDATSIGSHVGVFVFQASKQTIRGTRAWCDVLLIGPEAEM